MTPDQISRAIKEQHLSDTSSLWIITMDSIPQVIWSWMNMVKNVSKKLTDAEKKDCSYYSDVICGFSLL